MSQGHPVFPEHLPVLFFYEAPGERRQRIEGVQPAPAPVVLPRLDEPGGPGLDYRLIQFPWQPWQAGLETQSAARAYASWLNGIAAGRLATVVPLLGQAGAPVGGLREDPARLAELGRWMQRAFPALAAPMIEQGFLADDPWYRLGWARRTPSPLSQGYSRHLDALVGSVAHDLALIVADCARTARPGLAWQPDFETLRQRFVIGIDPGRPQADLIGEIADFLTQTAARPRGTRGHELRAWYGRTLLRGYERAARGGVAPEVTDVFPDARSVRGWPRRDILRRARPGSPPQAQPQVQPAELVTALDNLRAAGWFETVKRGSAQLARLVQASWRIYEGEDLPLDAAELYGRLLMLDSSRTWSDDVDAGVQPGDGIYGHLLEEVSHIRGKALGRLWDQQEDWASRPGDLLLRFRTREGKRQLLIPSPGRHLSAALFTGLNDLGPGESPRLWFVDQGPPVAIVTRATSAERAALEDSTGLRLDPDPPQWWVSLAPVPERRPPEPPAPSLARSRRDSAGKEAGSPQAGSPPAGRPATRSRVTGRGATGGRPSGRRPGTASRITAQAAFDHLMRDLIAPALHELGFTGKGPRWFAYRRGDYEGVFSTGKSRYSTREAVEFSVLLTAVYLPTKSPYWDRQLNGLILGDERLSRWTVRADGPAEPIADRLLRVFRSYGWPAIQAALDSPGYPPDPGVVWPRSFPPQPSPAVRGATGPNLGPLSLLLPRTGRRDDLLTGMTDPDELVRVGAVSGLGAAAGRDADVTAALLRRLEHDPSPGVRFGAARALGPLAGQPQVRRAFQAAAAEDEDLNVRWAARYVLRLADLAGQPGPQAR
jgi:hypothetical protein